jgi:hypothetical protein
MTSKEPTKKQLILHQMNKQLNDEKEINTDLQDTEKVGFRKPYIPEKDREIIEQYEDRIGYRRLTFPR